MTALLRPLSLTLLPALLAVALTVAAERAPACAGPQMRTISVAQEGAASFRRM